MTALPAWIDREAWNGYVEFRHEQQRRTRGKIAWTQRAETLVLKELYALHSLGHDANASLDQSVVHGWTDVYEPKEKMFTNTNPRPCMTSIGPKMSDEERARSDVARRQVMQRFR